MPKVPRPPLALAAFLQACAPGFRNYEDTWFRDAAFIWTQNLRLDNLVACRVTVAGRP